MTGLLREVDTVRERDPVRERLGMSLFFYRVADILYPIPSKIFSSSCPFLFLCEVSLF